MVHHAPLSFLYGNPPTPLTRSVGLIYSLPEPTQITTLRNSELDFCVPRKRANNSVQCKQTNLQSTGNADRVYLGPFTITDVLTAIGSSKRIIWRLHKLNAPLKSKINDCNTVTRLDIKIQLHDIKDTSYLDNKRTLLNHKTQSAISATFIFHLSSDILYIDKKSMSIFVRLLHRGFKLSQTPFKIIAACSRLVIL